MAHCAFGKRPHPSKGFPIGKLPDYLGRCTERNEATSELGVVSTQWWLRISEEVVAVWPRSYDATVGG